MNNLAHTLPDLCGACFEEDDEEETALGCDACWRWVHHYCAGFNDSPEEETQSGFAQPVLIKPGVLHVYSLIPHAYLSTIILHVYNLRESFSIICTPKVFSEPRVHFLSSEPQQTASNFKMYGSHSELPSF